MTHKLCVDNPVIDVKDDAPQQVLDNVAPASTSRELAFEVGLPFAVGGAKEIKPRHRRKDSRGILSLQLRQPDWEEGRQKSNASIRSPLESGRRARNEGQPSERTSESDQIRNVEGPGGAEIPLEALARSPSRCRKGTPPGGWIWPGDVVSFSSWCSGSC